MKLGLGASLTHSLIRGAGAGGTSSGGPLTGATVEAEGWSILVDVAGTAPGAPLALDPDGARRAKLIVTGPGFGADGAARDVTREIAVTGPVRRPFPDQAELDQTATPAGARLRLALSDHVHAGETAVLIVSEGWIEDAPAQALSVVANGSTLAHARAVGNWTRPDHLLIRGDIEVEFAAFHRAAENGAPLAAVIFEAEDGAGATVTATATAMEVSDWGGDAAAVLVYRATLPTAGLADGPVVVNARALPWVGDEGAVLDTRGEANGASVFARPQTFLLDRSGAVVETVAYVDAGAGDDGAGLAADLAAPGAAESAPFRTIGAAAEAIRARNAAERGRAECDGGVIRLKAGQHVWVGKSVSPATVSTTTAWLTITRDPAAPRSAVVLTSDGVSSTYRLRTAYTRIEDVTLSRVGMSNGQVFARGNVDYADLIWIDRCDVFGEGHSFPTFYNFGNVRWTRSAVDRPGQMFGQFGGGDRTTYALRGITATGQTKRPHGYAVFGCDLDAKQLDLNDKGTNATPIADGSVIAFNIFRRMTERLVELGADSNVADVAIVQNLVERISSVSPGLQVSADGALATARNVLLWHVTLAGARANLFYNDEGAAPVEKLLHSVRGCILEQLNMKSDSFVHPVTGASGARVGNWAVRNGAGFEGVLVRQPTDAEHMFRMDFDGLKSAYVADADFADDRTGAGGDGDYRPGPGSAAIGLIGAGRAVLPRDLTGAPRRNDGTGAAGCYEA